MVKLVLFPGLAADERTYCELGSLPVPLEVPAWPLPRSSRETLAEYARRIARTIDDRDGVYVGGLSFGAVVALEAALHLNVRGVFLISGCTSWRQIAPPFRLALVLAACLPRQWVRPVLRAAPPVLRAFERLDERHAEFMAQVLRDNAPSQTRWSTAALLGWQISRMPRVPVWSLHGERDEVIPLRHVRADAVVAGGRHLLTLTHPREVNRFLTERMAP